MDTRLNFYNNIENANHHSANWSNQSYISTSFDHSLLTNVNFENTSLSFCSFRNTLLTTSNLNNAFFVGSFLYNNTDFTATNVKNTLFLLSEIEGKPITRDILKDKGAIKSNRAITNLEKLNSAIYHNLLSVVVIENFKKLIKFYIHLFHLINKDIQSFPAHQRLLAQTMAPFATEKNILILKKAFHILSIKPVKTLKDLSAQYIMHRQSLFSTQLKKLPKHFIVNDLGLITPYESKFIRKMRQLLNATTFKVEQGKERAVLTKINQALNGNQPYRDVHLIISDLDKNFKTAYLSLFTQNLKPIRNNIVKLINKYLASRTKYYNEIESNNNNKTSSQ